MLFFGALAEPARGAGPAGAETPNPAQNALLAEIDMGGSGLDAERVRAAIARELAVDVRSAAAGSKEAPALVIRVDGGRATVRFQHPAGGTLERTVDLPPDPEQSYETVALLAGNLARNEAAELLEQLRRKAAPEVVAPAEGQAATSERPAGPAGESGVRPKTPERAEKPRSAPKKTARARVGRQPQEPPLTLANVSVFFPLALHPDSDRRTLGLELGLAYSRIGSLRGAALGLGGLEVQNELEGAALTVLWNRVRGPTTGALVAAGGNLGGGALRGGEVAAVFNGRSGSVRGAQVAAGLNRSSSVKGAQLAAGLNHNRGLEGVMLAAVNSAGDGGGLQGGLVNTAGTLSGAQLGVVNVGGRVRGVQIGLVNVAETIDGSAFGLVNVADEVDGAAFGLVNVVGDARTRVVGWVDSSARANVGIKYRHGWIFTLVSGAYRLNRLNEPDGKLLEPAFAIGGHLELGSSFVELDAQYSFRQASDEEAMERHLSRYRITLGHDPVPSFGGFIGAALEQSFDRDGSSLGGLAFAGLELF